MEGREARFRSGSLRTPADREHEKPGGDRRPHVPNHDGSFPAFHLMLQPTLAC